MDVFYISAKGCLKTTSLLNAHISLSDTHIQLFVIILSNGYVCTKVIRTQYALFYISTGLEILTLT